MAYKTFAAIDVGSSDISMKVFEVSVKKGFKEIDSVSRTLELGSDTYKSGVISNEKVEALCDILLGFKKKMREYGCQEYRAYATSAIREANNGQMVIEQMKLRAGIEIGVLSNSEHRFMMYKGISAQMKDFNSVTSKNAAIVDIGAGSIQLTLFEKQLLSATQNIRIGSVRIRETMADLKSKTTRIDQVIEEYVENEISTFKNFYLSDKDIKNVIAVGDDIDMFVKIIPKLSVSDSINQSELDNIYEKISLMNPQELAAKYGIPFERATILLPIIIIYRLFLKTTKADKIYTPKICLCDGIVVDYMDRERKISLPRNFNNDILAEASHMAKRYRCNRTHIDNVMKVALAVFDSMKKIHGLGERERLQLQIAVFLHDCGKFINMREVGFNSYNIIMSTEIMGLSHKEREEVANVVRFNTRFLPSYNLVKEELGAADYLIVAKLAAILRIANATDRSHKQKIEKFSVALKERKLVITADTVSDITLETGLFQPKADFFEQVYGIRPILKQKRSI